MAISGKRFNAALRSEIGILLIPSLMAFSDVIAAPFL